MLFYFTKNIKSPTKIVPKKFGLRNIFFTFAKIKEHEDSDVKASGFFYFLCFKQE